MFDDHSDLFIKYQIDGSSVVQQVQINLHIFIFIYQGLKIADSITFIDTSIMVQNDILLIKHIIIHETRPQLYCSMSTFSCIHSICQIHLIYYYETLF